MTRFRDARDFKVESTDGRFDVYTTHHRGKFVVAKDSHIIRANLVQSYVPAIDVKEIPHFLNVPSSIPKAA